MSLRAFKSLIPVLALACATGSAQAQSPFGVSIDSATLPPLSRGYSSFPNLLSDVLNTNQEFAAYSQTAFTAAFTFLGTPSAIIAASNADGTQVSIQIPGIGFSHTWTGATRGIVQSQIHDFFIKNGNQVEGSFLKYIARTSPMALTDGNPNASTARMASTSFTQFGFVPLAYSQTASGASSKADSSAAGASSASKPRLSTFGIGLNSGHFSAAGIQGQKSELDVPFSKQLTDRVGLAGVIPLDYMNVQGGKVYGLGLVLGLPIWMVQQGDDQPWSWRLTPMVGLSLGGSEDLAGGGLIWNAGLTSCEGIDLGRVTIDFVNQYADYQSATVKYSGYKFNPDVDQGIFKNGVRASGPILPRIRYDVFIIETQFIHPAAVKSFTTYGGSVCFLTGSRFNATVGANIDDGPGFKAWSVGLSSAWAF